MPVATTRLPDSYPRQVGLTCGEANARSVVESFGLRYSPEPRPRWWVRLLGYSLVGDLRRLLTLNELEVEVGQAVSLERDEKIRLLKSHIDAGEPVILSVGNGYLRRGRYTRWTSLLLGHYLTIYGYDDRQGFFFVYDSFLGGDPTEPLAGGNEVRDYQAMIRDWRGPLYYPLIGRRYSYLAVRRVAG